MRMMMGAAEQPHRDCQVQDSCNPAVPAMAEESYVLFSVYIHSFIYSYRKRLASAYSESDIKLGGGGNQANNMPWSQVLEQSESESLLEAGALNSTNRIKQNCPVYI